MRAFAHQLDELLRWGESADPFMLNFARNLLGRDAFCLGFSAGMINYLPREVARFSDGIAELAGMFVLADLYDLLARARSRRRSGRRSDT